MQQRELKNKEIKQIAARVEIETYHRLRKVAFKNNTSMSSIMEDAIIEHLDKNEKERRANNVSATRKKG